MGQGTLCHLEAEHSVHHFVFTDSWITYLKFKFTTCYHKQAWDSSLKFGEKGDRVIWHETESWGEEISWGLGGQKWRDDLFQNLMAPKWITSYAFGHHLCEILMVGKGEDGRGEDGWKVRARARCRGRHGSVKFIVLSFPSCLFSLALLWSRVNHSWQFFFYSFGGVGTEQVISCWFGSENLNCPGRSLVQFLES